MLVGRRSPCLWVFILVVLVVDKLFEHERKRKKKILVEGSDLTVRKGRGKK